MRLSSSWGRLLQVVYQVELTELSYQQNSQFAVVNLWSASMKSFKLHHSSLNRYYKIKQFQNSQIASIEKTNKQTKKAI